MSDPFRVGLTRDFLKKDGTLGFGDIGLGLLEAAEDVRWEFLEQDTLELEADQIKHYDALIVLAPRVTASSLAGVQRLKIIARFGVGYDTVDLGACTRGGVMLTITPDGVRRPVATGVITFLLALSYKLVIKDRMTREGRWNEKLGQMGRGLTGRTLGVVGVGNIGKEIFRLAAPFEMHHLGFDPFVNQEDVRGLEVHLVELDLLLRKADYVVICCALLPETRHLIDVARLALMKPAAYLINVSRGAVVDQAALTSALRENRIQGAGLDVFEQEPIDPKDPLLQMDQVMVTPHAICWTDEMFLGTGRSACEGILDLAAGRVPKHLVNREVIHHPRFRGLIAGG